LEPDAVPQVGEQRGISETINDPARARQLYSEHQTANRFIRVMNGDRFVEFAWRNEYAGGNKPIPLAWVDARGYLVVDMAKLFPGSADVSGSYRPPMPAGWMETPKESGR
jgi:hypothetical protein